MSTLPIRRVMVLGGGIMGSGIAAHLAGAGIPVILLDIVPEGAGNTKADRNRLATTALEKLKKAKPPALFHPRDLELIEVGNIDDDLSRVSKCDWVIEAVREDLATKQALYAKLEPFLAPHTIISSNTSGLPIAKLLEGRSSSFQERFLVTHFFNPVRYMYLLEIIPGPKTQPAIVQRVAQFGEEVLGKGIVFGYDTPNFVGNRIGLHALLETVRLAIEGDYTVEEVDAIFGPALGRPKSAIFRTIDMVGLDTLIYAANTCYHGLPYDAARDAFSVPPLFINMQKQGMLGEKSGGGFYKKTAEGILSLDLKTLTYRPQQRPQLATLSDKKRSVSDRIRSIFSSDDRVSRIATRALLLNLAYASKRIGPRTDQNSNLKDPAICENLLQIDRALRWGFNWEFGPFELWDEVGVTEVLSKMNALEIRPATWVEQMVQSGQRSFYTGQAPERFFYDPSHKAPQLVTYSPRQISLSTVLAHRAPVLKNDGASLIDLGDGVACLSFHTKMNAIDTDVIEMIQKSIDRCQIDFEALVIGNEGKDAFSAGANLLMILMAATQGNWPVLEKVIRDFQNANQLLRHSSIPVVIAPFGLTLGGGAEVALHGAVTRAHSELYMGLVETGVGLIPAGGGCKEMLGRILDPLPEEADPFPAIRQVFQTLALAKVSASAEEAKRLGYLNEHDGISMNKSHLLYDAKQTALFLSRAGYKPPRKRQYRLPGLSAFATLRSWLHNMHAAHQITEHDVKVGTALAKILTGGQTSVNRFLTEQEILDLEREEFLKLCGEEKTRERIAYMLQNNKPLRN